ncbi:MAG: hypothetical protein K1060chlam2_01257 [Chlamydiae bacterium]|nr:hypothetical protein [Chlamydiota bacterium]
MNSSTYHSLIDDTLTYVKALLPESGKPKKRALPKVQKAAPQPPQIKPAAPEKKKIEKPSFKLESHSAPSSEPNVGMKKLLMEIAPELFLHEGPPSDARARRINEAWKEKRDTPTIPILIQGRAYRSFVVNIAKAIDSTFGTCRLIEVEPKKKWDLFFKSPNLKLIIAPDNLIFSSRELLPFYKENPQEKRRTLGDIPLLLLPDLSLYYKDPYLKRSLWNVITQNLLPLS